jgi:hypothetical protein
MKKNLEMMDTETKRMDEMKGKWEMKTSRVAGSIFVSCLGVLVGLLV